MQADPIAQHAMNAELGCKSGRAPWRRIARAVMNLAGPHAEFLRHAQKPWASVTFSGARHTIGLSFSGEQASHDADLFITALPDHEFAIAGSLVANATITSVDQCMMPEPQVLIEAELLLLDDA